MKQLSGATVVLGLQWGDEGKGKIIDPIAKDYDYVVRYQGGNNAGHTVMRGDKVYKFHLLPSGILETDKISVLGNGTVIDCYVLKQEIENLEHTPNLKIAQNAHLIMPWHIKEDELQEAARGGAKIGTTGRGIGPCYVDKVARRGFRMSDLMDDEQAMVGKLRHLAIVHGKRLSRLYDQDISFDIQVIDDFRNFAHFFKEYIADTAYELARAMRNNQRALLEGAQGTMLDIDFGSYPFVTSSSPTSGGASSGSGIAPTHIHQVIGVTKAYTTRVGEGPFMTEGNSEDDDWLRNAGHEFGTTTGRARRCGWLDLVLLDYAISINGVTELAVTKLDVLTGRDTIPVCTHYQDSVPYYEYLPGWSEDLTAIQRFEDMPQNAQSYILYIQDKLNVRVSMIGVGPRQDQIILTPW